MRIQTIDTETTGLKGEIIEIASVIASDGSDWILSGTLVKPQGAISFASMAIHHLTEEMVSDARTLDEVVICFVPESDVDYLVGHNIDFDLKFLDNRFKQHKTICTMKLAKILGLKEKAGSVGNMALYYYFGGYKEFTPDGEPHRALYDAQITTWLLFKMCDEFDLTLDQCYDLINKDFKCNFKKHKGKQWIDVCKEELDYVEWMLDNFEWQDTQERDKLQKVYNDYVGVSND